MYQWRPKDDRVLVGLFVATLLFLAAVVAGGGMGVGIFVAAIALTVGCLLLEVHGRMRDR